jgi:hypothetical protein
MWAWLLVITINFSQACEDKICDRICQRDGEKRGIVVNGECGCWNPNYKVQIKVPKIGWVYKERPVYYEQR